MQRQRFAQLKQGIGGRENRSLSGPADKIAKIMQEINADRQGGGKGREQCCAGNFNKLIFIFPKINEPERHCAQQQRNGQTITRISIESETKENARRDRP
jgi:hypothetical protein